MSIIKRIIVLLLLISPVAANAQAALPIPVMAFGQAYTHVFESIAMLVNSNAFQHIMDFCLLLGFMSVISRSTIVAGQGLLKALTNLWVVSYVLIVVGIKATIPVQIADIPNNYYNSVQKVPLIIAVAEYATHTVGYYLSKALNTTYGSVSRTPQEMLSTGSPFGLAPALVADGTQYEIQDPYLKDSLSNYVVDCVYSQVANGRLSREDLLHSNDLFNKVIKAGNNPASMTVYYGTQSDHATYGGIGKVKSCAFVSKQLSSKLSEIQSNMLKSLGQYMSGGLDATFFQNALNFYSGSNPKAMTPGQLLMQSAMLGIWRNDAPRQAALKTSSERIFQQLAIAQAKQNVFANWEISAATFKETWGYAVTAIDLLIIGLFPLVLLTLFIPPLSHMMTKFLGLLTFVPAIDVSVTIAQMIGTQISHSSLNPFFGSDGLTLANQMFVSKQAVHAMSMADWMLTLSMVIATGLCFGFMYVGSKLSADSNAARESASATEQAVKGNEALDNRSYNNTSANKANTVFSQSIGAGTSSAAIATAPLGVTNYGGTFKRVNESPMTEQLGHNAVATHTQSGTGIVATSQSNTLGHSASQGISADHSTQTTRAVSTSLSGSGIGAGAVMGAYEGLKSSFAKTGINFDAIPQKSQEAILSNMAQGEHHAMMASKAQAQGNTQVAQAEEAKSEGFFSKAYDATKALAKDHPYLAAGAVGALAVGAVTGIDEVGAAVAGAGAAVGSAAMTVGRYASGAIASVGRSFGRLFGSEGSEAIERAAASEAKGSGGYGFSAGGVKGTVGDSLMAEGRGAGALDRGLLGKGKKYLTDQGKGLLLGAGGSVNFNEDISGDTTGKDVIKKSSSSSSGYDQRSQDEHRTQTSNQWSLTTVDTVSRSYQVPMGGGSRIQFMDDDNHPEPRSAMDRAREMHAAYKAKNQTEASKVESSGERIHGLSKSDQDSTASKERKQINNPLQMGD